MAASRRDGDSDSLLCAGRRIAGLHGRVLPFALPRAYDIAFAQLDIRDHGDAALRREVPEEEDKGGGGGRGKGGRPIFKRVLQGLQGNAGVLHRPSLLHLAGAHSASRCVVPRIHEGQAELLPGIYAAAVHGTRLDA